MECPPEAVVHFACQQAVIEFMLGPAFQSLPTAEGGMLIWIERRENAGPVGEEQGVADVEEDEFELGHERILCNESEESITSEPAAAEAAVILRCLRHD